MDTLHIPTHPVSASNIPRSTGTLRSPPSLNPPFRTLAVEPPALTPAGSFFAPYCRYRSARPPSLGPKTGMSDYGQGFISRFPLHEASSAYANGDNCPRHMHHVLLSPFSDQSKLIRKPIPRNLLGQLLQGSPHRPCHLLFWLAWPHGERAVEEACPHEGPGSSSSPSPSSHTTSPWSQAGSGWMSTNRVFGSYPAPTRDVGMSSVEGALKKYKKGHR